MKILSSLILIILTCLAFASSSRAGAWCMKPGSFYGKLSYNQYFTVYTFDHHGSSKRNSNGSTFRDINYTFYAEYGLLKNLTVFSSLPYKNLKSHFKSTESGEPETVTFRYHGFGDIEVGLKYCVIEKPIVLSIQVLSKFAWLYDGHDEVPPGNNQNDYELKILLGKSLWPFPGYCGMELGYRWRTNDPSDEYRYLLELGLNITKNIFCRIKLDGIKSVKNANLPPVPEPFVSTYIDEETGQVIKDVYETSAGSSTFANPSLGLEYDLAKLELTVGGQFTKKWSCEFTYTNYPYGENIADGDQYSFALIYYY
jgi:hypothetical protein